MTERQSKSGKKNVCPIDGCTKNLNVNTLKDAKLAKDITSEYDIYCTTNVQKPEIKNLSYVCLEIVKVKDLETHLSQCQHVSVMCASDGCDLRIKKKDLENHVKECKFALEDCKWCHVSVKRRDVQTHASNCIHRPVSCPNASKCGENKLMQRDELQIHKKICPYETVCCPYKQTLGCNHQCIRNDMNKHSSDISFHFSYVVNQLEQKDNKINELKRNYENLQVSYNDLKESHSELKSNKVSKIQEKLDQLEEDSQWIHATFAVSLPYNAGETTMESEEFLLGGTEFSVSLDLQQTGKNKNYAGIFLNLKRGLPSAVKAKFIARTSFVYEENAFFTLEKTFFNVSDGWSWGAPQFFNLKDIQKYIKDDEFDIRVTVWLKNGA